MLRIHFDREYLLDQIKQRVLDDLVSQLILILGSSIMPVASWGMPE